MLGNRTSLVIAEPKALIQRYRDVNLHKSLVLRPIHTEHVYVRPRPSTRVYTRRRTWTDVDVLGVNGP